MKNGFQIMLQWFMALAERKKEIYDEDILLLIVSLHQEAIEAYHLEA